MASEASPSIAGAPKLARRAAAYVEVARAVGFDAARLRLSRMRRVQAEVRTESEPSMLRQTIRRVDALLDHNGRRMVVRTTDVAPEVIEGLFREALAQMWAGPVELFNATPSVRLGTPPTGPFDALDLVDPALAPADPDAIRGLALAVGRTSGTHVTVTGESEAEAVARTDGTAVAWHHTRVGVELVDGPLQMRRWSRTLGGLPEPGALADGVQVRRTLLGASAAAPVERSLRLVLHPEAGARLVAALVRLPLRTARLSDRLSVVADPWVSGGLGARPFDAAGDATRPVPLIEGGLQRRRHTDTMVGDLRVARGGRALGRLLAETERGVCVVGWHRVDVHAETGVMAIEGYGWNIVDGVRIAPLPRIVLRGRLPALFRRLSKVGSDPWVHGPVRTPTLVFDDVRVWA